MRRTMVGAVLVAGGLAAACGGGGGGSVELAAAFARSVDGEEPIEEIDASVESEADVVLEIESDGDAGSVRVDLTADVSIDGLDLTGSLDRFAFDVVDQDDDGFLVVVRIGPLFGASEVAAIAENLEEAGIDPADAGSVLVEDRGGDGVLEVEVRIRGEISSTEEGDLEVSEDVTFDVVESGDAPPIDEDTTTTTATTVNPVPPEDEAGGASVVDGVLRIEGPAGSSVEAAIPAGWEEVSLSGPSASYFTPTGTIGITLDSLFRPSFEDQVASALSTRFAAIGSPGFEPEERTVDGRDARFASGDDGSLSVLVFVIDLGDAVLAVDLYGPVDSADTDLEELEAFVDELVLEPSG